MKRTTCRICQSSFKQEYTLREMMLGLRDEFIYGECNGCGAIQIMEIPVNIEKYYPPYYYSFNINVPPLKRLPLQKRLVAKSRAKRKYEEGGNHILDYLKPVGTMP